MRIVLAVKNFVKTHTDLSVRQDFRIDKMRLEEVSTCVQLSC